jgi:serine/threonine-protein kinase RsbW
LTLPSDLSFLPLVRSFVEAMCRLGGLDAKTTHEIVLATHEAVSNVIRHAHRDRPQELVHVQLILSVEQIEIFLLDQGEPFNVGDVPQMDPTELRCGGRGVFLMRALMDELVSCPGAQGGNTLRMVKRLGTAPAPTARDAG